MVDASRECNRERENPDAERLTPHKLSFKISSAISQDVRL